VRLVTLTGPGGTGKTRLSLETAKSLQKGYQNAVWFVPLAHIAEPGFLPNAILDAMDLQPPASIEPFKHLVTVLSRNRSVLVLDNFEHWLSDSSPTFSDESRKIVRTLLERVPTLRCLVTSRRRLGLFGEREFPLEPLPVPFEPATIEEMSRCESVQLFVDRVQSVRPSFQITGANANVIAEICCRLEGIPLALELAAAQMQVLTPGQVLKSLSRRLDFLTDRRRQVEARHQQLRATIDWSFQLLTPEAQTFFAALSAFRDGGNLSDVDAICNEPLALDHLALLQDFSFLRLEENRTAVDMRFRLLETLREYGEEKLTPAERGVLRENHARHFLKVAETAAPLLKGETQSTWLGRLEQDHQNFLSALDWCLETTNVESGLRLACALSPFWVIRSHVRLGRERLSEFWNLPERESVAPGIRAAALSSAGDLALAASDFASARSLHDECLKLYQQQRDLAGQAQALIDLGRTAFEQGDYMAARPFGEEGLKLWRKLGDDYGAAVSLNTLGLVACEQGNYAEALTSYNESLGLRRKIGDKRGIAAQLNNLGVVYRRQGNYVAAKRVFLESLEIQRELENRRNIAGSLSNLGLVAEHEQDYAAARSLQEESLSIRREVGDDWGVARSLTILGIINRHEGDDAAAQTLFEESLAICRRIGNKLGIGQTLCNLGDLFSAINNCSKAQTHLMESIELMSELNNKQGLTDVLQAYSRLSLAQGQYETSTKLFFAAKALRRTIGAQLPPYEQTEIEQQLTTLQTALDPEIFLKAQNSGVAMTIEQATRIAIEI
jgi:predicted ATPase/Tfp pilus assembly protein PilF